MIFTLIINLCLMLLNGAISILPSVSSRDTAILSSFSSTVSDLHSTLAEWNWLFPMDDLSAVIIAMSAVLFAYFTFHLALRIFGR
jgi:hypothetical protein